MGILARIDSDTSVRLRAHGERRDSLENPNVSLSDPGAFAAMFGGWWHSSAGVTVTPEVVLGIPAAWCAINFIAGTIAALPLFIYRDGPNGREPATSDPLYWILHDQVNDDKLTSFGWRKALMVNTLLHGRSITFIERNGAGKVMNLWPLVVGQVVIERVNGRRQYKYRENNRQVIYRADEVIDIPFLMRPDGLRHYDPVSLFSDSFGLTVALERYASKFFQNGGVPPLSMEMPAGASAGAGKRGALNIEELLKQAHEGGNLVLPMPAGHVLKQIGFNPENGQLLEARNFQIRECARVWDLPPVFLQDLVGSTFANAEQQDLILVKHTLTQWLKAIEQELNSKLLGPRTRCNIEHNLDGLLRGDFTSRMAGMASGVQNGLMTPDEGRELNNMPRMGGPASKLYIQGATVELGSNKPPSAAPPAAPAADGGNNGDGPAAPAKRSDEARYSPDQPRVPAGSPDGGQWGGGSSGGGGASPSAGAPSKEQLSALNVYTGPGFSEINSSLRTGQEPANAFFSESQRASYVGHLDNFIQHSGWNENATVYRGVGGKTGEALAAAMGNGELKVGQSFTDKGFISTSRDPSVANDAGPGRTPPAAQMVVHLTPGSRAADIAKYGIANEKEVLLARGTKFTVRSYDAKTKTMHVDAS